MTYRGNLALHRKPEREGRVLLTFRSRLSSPSVELMLSYSRVLEGLCRLFFTESWARVLSALESSLSVSGTASFRSVRKHDLHLFNRRIFHYIFLRKGIAQTTASTCTLHRLEKTHFSYTCTFITLVVLPEKVICQMNLSVQIQQGHSKESTADIQEFK